MIRIDKNLVRRMTAFVLALISLYARSARAIAVYNPIKAESVPELINNIVTTILGIVGAIALFMFVYGGIMWMTSAGNQQRIDRGRETLSWAAIGLVIIFTSYAILSAVFNALTGV